MNRDDQQEMIPDGSESGQDRKWIIVGQAFSITFNLTLALIFYVYSSNEDKYGGDECVNLRQWVKFFIVYAITVFMIRLFVVLPLSVTRKSDWKSSLIQSVDYVDTALMLLFLIAFTFLLVLKEPCAQLRTVTLLFVIMIYSWIMLLLCCCGCSYLVNGEEDDKRHEILQ